MPYSPRRKLPTPGHSEFSPTVAFTYRGKLKRHLQRDHPLPNMRELKKTDPEAFERELRAFHEARNKGEKDPKRMWVGLTSLEIEKFSEHVLQTALTRDQRVRMFEEFKHRVRELKSISRETVFLVKDGYELARAPDYLPPISLQTLLDLAHIFSEPDDLPRGLKHKFSTPSPELPQLGKLLYKAALFELLSQHLEFNHINAVPGQVRDGVDRIVTHYSHFDANLEQLIPQIERRIIAQKRLRQSVEHKYHPARKKFLEKIQREIGDYYFPNRLRKKIYREALQYQIEGKPVADILHYAENQAFKESRQYLRTFLQGLGYRPDKLLPLLGVREMDPNSIQTMKRLWKLFKKFKGQPAAQKAFIDRAMRLAEYRQRAAEGKNRDPNGHNEKSKRVKEVRPKKPRPTLEEIRLTAEQAPRTIPLTKPREEIPASLDKLVRLFSTSPHVTHEMFVALKRVMREEASKKVAERNNGLLLEGCKFWILSYVTAEYGFDGRLIEGKLHDLFPPALHLTYQSARDELIRQGFLKYEHHMTSGNHIALTDYAKKTGIGKKFDTKQNLRRRKK